MTEDWVAVANAIKERVNELGWRQRELAQRSHVSQAIVRELQHHTVERRRSARTLEALSLALGWPPQHLAAVLRALERRLHQLRHRAQVGEGTAWPFQKP